VAFVLKKFHREIKVANFINSPYAVIFKGCNFCNSEKADCNALR